MCRRPLGVWGRLHGENGGVMARISRWYACVRLLASASIPVVGILGHAAGAGADGADNEVWLAGESILSNDQLTRGDMTSFYDLSFTSTALSFDTFNRSFAMKGIVPSSNRTGSDPTVGIYIDDAYMPSLMATNFDPMLFQTVDVAVGDFGLATMHSNIGGGVHLTSHKPTDDLEIVGSVHVGSVGWTNVAARSSGPVTDRIGILVAALYEVRDGLVENKAENGSADDLWSLDDYAFQVQIAAQLGERTDIWLSYTLGSHDQSANPLILISDYNTLSPVPAGLTYDGVRTSPSDQIGNPQEGYSVVNPGANSNYEANYDFSGMDKVEGYSHMVAKVHSEFGSLAVDLTANVSGFEKAFSSDYDRTSRVGIQLYEDYQVKDDWQGLLFEVSTKDDAELAFRVGASWFSEIEDRHYALTAPNNLILAIGTFDWDGLVANNFTDFASTFIVNPDGLYFDQLTSYENTTTAGFGEIVLRNQDRTLSITSGLRFSHDRKEATEAQIVRFELGDASTNGLGFPLALDISHPISFLFPSRLPVPIEGRIENPRTISKDWNNLDSHLKGTFRSSPNTLWNASLVRATRSGGLRIGSLEKDFDTDPETLLTVSGGVSKIQSPTFAYKASVFLSSYSDMQLAVVGIEGDRAISNYSNPANAQAFGVDLEAAWEPVDNLFVNFAYTWNSSKYADPETDFTDPTDINSAFVPYGDTPIPIFIDGNTLPMAPQHSFVSTSTYVVTGNAGDFFGRLQIAYDSEQFFSPFNDADRMVEAQLRIDAQAGWTSETGRYELKIFVKNLQDEQIVTNITRADALHRNQKYAAIGDPFVSGLNIRIRY